MSEVDTEGMDYLNRKAYISDDPEYKIKESELFFITNEITATWWVFWPFNHRYRLQQALKKMLRRHQV